jgi:para-aminobenzoate synthetase component 1
VEAIRAKVAAGDVYQVNHTVRCALGPQAPAAILSRLCARGVPRFLAWVRLPDGTELVSASPECFFTLDGRTLRVEPMKGTAAVGEDARLEASVKDQAELAMITDLLRNDLTRVCVPKSVRVRAARRLIRLPYAVQAVSEVEGQLEAGTSLTRVLEALHPAGSITGAPKRAAVATISELEETPRGPYCGALLFREGARATASLLIRTAFRDGEGWQFGVGGGITWRSTVEGEWRELLIKLEALR